ncbi:hypothetical protein [Dongshaea marina]|uniref:hypothetical protein n=1 Tax=Dongshaea marina TaxID=2047966 RepID=UPI000D3E2BAE|nr:hypothetical protein [Dongshaea marina]
MKEAAHGHFIIHRYPKLLLLKPLGHFNRSGIRHLATRMFEALDHGIEQPWAYLEHLQNQPSITADGLDELSVMYQGLEQRGCSRFVSVSDSRLSSMISQKCARQAGIKLCCYSCLEEAYEALAEDPGIRAQWSDMEPVEYSG